MLHLSGLPETYTGMVNAQLALLNYTATVLAGVFWLVSGLAGSRVCGVKDTARNLCCLGLLSQHFTGMASALPVLPVYIQTATAHLEGRLWTSGHVGQPELIVKRDAANRSQHLHHSLSCTGMASVRLVQPAYMKVATAPRVDRWSAREDVGFCTFFARVIAHSLPLRLKAQTGL